MAFVYLSQFGGCAIAHFFILYGWYVLLGNCLPPKPSAFRLLLSMTLLWVQIVSVVLALGLMGNLTRFNVVFANLSIGAAAAAAGLYGRGMWPPFRQTIASLSLSGTWAWMRREPAIALTLLAAGFAFVWYVTLAIFFPPLGYDDMAYHLPGAAFALQNHALMRVDLPVRLQAINYFPQICEFLSVWCFSLVGSDAMIVVWQGGIYLYFATACYVLCRVCGCTRNSSLFALSLAAVTPTLLAQILTSYNDVCVVAFFSAALAFAVTAGRDPSRINLLALGLSCSGLLSGKLSTPLLVCVALGVFIAQQLIQRSAMPHLMRSLAFVLLIASLLGGYWYIRNFLFYGNPFYPFVVHIAGVTLPGTAAPLTPAFLNPQLGHLPLLQRLWGLWLEQRSHYGYWFYNYESASTGFGPVWFILGVPSIIAGALLSIGRRQWTVLAVITFTVAAYLGFDGNMSVRYTLFILPVMVLGSALMVDQMRLRRKDGGKRLPALVALWSLLLTQSLGAVLVVLTVFLMAFAVKHPEGVYQQIVASTVPKIDVPSPVLDVFSYVRKTLPKHSVVIFDETVDFIYPLWRPDFANRVCFVSSAQTMDRWTSVASSLKARYLFAKISPTTPASAQSPLANWIALHPSSFRLLATVPNYGELYELL